MYPTLVHHPFVQLAKSNYEPHLWVDLSKFNQNQNESYVYRTMNPIILRVCVTERGGPYPLEKKPSPFFLRSTFYELVLLYFFLLSRYGLVFSLKYKKEGYTCSTSFSILDAWIIFSWILSSNFN